MFQHNVNIKKMNSWGIASTVTYFAEPQDEYELQKILKGSPSNVPRYFLGLGSNILPAEDQLDVVVVRMRRCLQNIQYSSERIGIDAGVSCAKVAKMMLSKGHRDAVFFAGIPGTMGGALRMNAGAFGGETWRYCLGVDCLDERGHFVHVRRDELKISYRQISLPKDWCIIRGWFSFPSKPGEANLIASLLQSRMTKQPIGQRSCGSVFKNPTNHYAAELIDSLGLKGLQEGEIAISEKHANFMINHGHASGQETLKLMRHVQDLVAQHYGILLEPEVIIWENQKS
ncbi:MAG: UDP-N-acetylmuramate dehydrogenase [Candidatus Comchoanobacterales bacterium]